VEYIFVSFKCTSIMQILDYEHKNISQCNLFILIKDKMFKCDDTSSFLYRFNKLCLTITCSDVHSFIICILTSKKYIINKSFSIVYNSIFYLIFIFRKIKLNVYFDDLPFLKVMSHNLSYKIHSN